MCKHVLCKKKVLKSLLPLVGCIYLGRVGLLYETLRNVFSFQHAFRGVPDLLIVGREVSYFEKVIHL